MLHIRDKYTRVHWIMLHIRDKYTQYSFCKESGVELQDSKLQSYFALKSAL